MSNDKVNYETLSPDLAKKFFETAIQLYGIQKERADRLKVWLPILLAIITVLSSAIVQFTSNRNQALLKHYEGELKPKQEGYSAFMKSFNASMRFAFHNDTLDMRQELDNLENSFYDIEPLLSISDRDTLWEKYQQFSEYCYVVLASDEGKKHSKESALTYLNAHNYFRTNLYSALFKSEKGQASEKLKQTNK